MGAIKVHHTETDDRRWDGPGNEAKLKSGESQAYYRRAYAWQDPEGDPTTKAAYKFIHHFVDGDGNPGAASTRGCSAGIAVLNGGRGGADIPDSDRQGVYNHLAAHLRDADMEPPDLRENMSPTVERRFFSGELRAQGEGEELRIIGYAALFNSQSENLGGWREMIMPGAFAKTLEGDIRALFNHDPNLVLGRNKANTLSLVEDDIGLRYEILPPDTRYASDLVVSIRRGDVSGSSFAFYAIEESWRNPSEEEPLPVRMLHEVQLFDVSPVTFPAYPVTSVTVRDMAQQLALAGRATGQEGGDGAVGRLALRRRRLDLLERL
jgi:hypothetical protein